MPVVFMMGGGEGTKLGPAEGGGGGGSYVLLCITGQV